MTASEQPAGGNRWRILVWGGAAVLLAAPLVAMWFTREVTWTGSDFAVFGTLLLVACGACELLARQTSDLAYRAGAGLAVAGGFLLVWIDMAVGIIGDDIDPANLMFAAILLAGIIGAIVSRLRPAGMAKTMAAMAAMQLVAGAIALIARLDPIGDRNWTMAMLALTGGFTALWLAAAWLFNRAAR